MFKIEKWFSKYVSLLNSLVLLIIVSEVVFCIVITRQIERVMDAFNFINDGPSLYLTALDTPTSNE